MKWLLMIAVLTGFAACGEEVAFIEDVKIYLKNGTDGRAIDYCHYASLSLLPTNHGVRLVKKFCILPEQFLPESRIIYTDYGGSVFQDLSPATTT